MAQLALGETESAREIASEAVALMAATGNWHWPCAHAKLIRAQIELDEPASGVEASLDRYEGVLDETGYGLFRPELFELRALLAEREGDTGRRRVELQRAFELFSEMEADFHTDRLRRELAL